MPLSILADQFIQQFRLERRALLEKVREFIVFEALSGFRVYEVIESGRLMYVHDYAVICEVDVQREYVLLRFADNSAVARHRDLLGGLGVEENSIRFRCFEEFPLDAAKLMLRETAEIQKGHWFEKLREYKGGRRALCIKCARPRRVTFLGVAPVCEALEQIPGFEALGPVQEKDGLTVACQEKPDVIFISIDRLSPEPWMLFDQMKMHDRLKDVPIVAVYESIMQARGAPGRSGGALLPDAWLPMPCQPQDVGRVLCEVLDVDKIWYRLKDLVGEYILTTASQAPSSVAWAAEGARGKTALDKLRGYGRGKAILCIDVESTDYDLLKLTLEQEEYGFEVRYLVPGIQGFVEAGEEKPDVLVVSIDLPHKNAWHIFEQIKANDQLKEARVVGIVPRLYYQEGALGLQRGPWASIPDAFLARTFNPLELGIAVCEALGISLNAS